MTEIDRRRFISWAGGVSTVALAGAFPAHGQTPKAAPITMVINQSPWFDGFRSSSAVQTETGNRISRREPVCRCAREIRNSLRASEGN